MSNRVTGFNFFFASIRLVSLEPFCIWGCIYFFHVFVVSNDIASPTVDGGSLFPFLIWCLTSGEPIASGIIAVLVCVCVSGVGTCVGVAMFIFFYLSNNRCLLLRHWSVYKY